jgi:succinate-semialdehyde dehydrogenase/glutarate-semialdehyde dehydrogenase
MPTLVSKNITTGETIREFNCTSPDELPLFFERAHAAQNHWAINPLKSRIELLDQLRETLLNHLDDLVELISMETGKPKFESLSNEVIPSLDLLTYYGKRSKKLLKNQSISLRLFKHRKSYLTYDAYGVVAIISSWNYPFLIPFSNIFLAILTGNAVIFKPNRLTLSIGQKIQEIFLESGIPPYVLQTVIGDSTLGTEIIRNKPNKIFFTGSSATGSKVMAGAAEHLIPVHLQLGAKNSLIVLPDADLDFATSAALWGKFCNSGQSCATVERIFIHERIFDPFLALFKEKISKLKPQSSLDPSFYELGITPSEERRSHYLSQIKEAESKEAEILLGGKLAEDQPRIEPTLIVGKDIEKLALFQEETLGPIATLTRYKSIAEVIQKSNQGKYGLIACIITKNISMGEQIAKQLNVGTVLINEVVYSAAQGDVPWGGTKNSGIGRTHSDVGLYEFVQLKHIQKPRVNFFTFKSPWWFPYSIHQYDAFRSFAELYRKSWLDQLKALAHFLWKFTKYLKSESRI